MRVGQLFAVPMVEFQLEKREPLLSDLRALFLEAEKQGDKYQNETRRDTQHGELFESRFDLFRWSEPPAQALAKFCHTALASALKELSDYSAEEFARLRFDYHAWFHVTRKGGYQGTHNHANASWSGIFCVDPGDPVAERPESGAVRFHDPRSGSNYYMDAGNSRLKLGYRHGGYQIQHEAGRLLIFPSYVLHEVFPYMGERPRIVVAFNCWISQSA